MVITEKNAKTKQDFAALIFNRKNQSFQEFMQFTERMLGKYAYSLINKNEVSLPIAFICKKCDRPTLDLSGELCDCVE